MTWLLFAVLVIFFGILYVKEPLSIFPVFPYFLIRINPTLLKSSKTR
jgi:hypothetical protein